MPEELNEEDQKIEGDREGEQMEVSSAHSGPGELNEDQEIDSGIKQQESSGHPQGIKILMWTVHRLVRRDVN